MLGEYFGNIWITGEVSKPTTSTAGHCYFTLKDESAQVSAVCWRSTLSELSFKLVQGLKIIGHGRLSLYEAGGKYELVLDRVEPSGRGALQEAFEQLKAKLEKEGLFAAGRKRALPLLPKVIGLVTSPAGAVLHDVTSTLAEHQARLLVRLFPAQVQGEDAAAQIADGVRVLSAQADVELIIVARGGGSMEDLWPFNEEVVARAIAASRVPVVSGVGHETDFTIADFVADVRAATPTAAAQLVARGWDELAGRLSDNAAALVEAVERMLLEREREIENLVQHRSFELVRQRLSEAGHRLERGLLRSEAGVRGRLRQGRSALNALDRRLAFQHPSAVLERQRARLGQLGSSLEAGRRARMEGTRSLLVALRAKLDALSPLASLARGYSICRKPDGTIVSRAGQVQGGDDLDVRVRDGVLECQVKTAREFGG